jgi:hypothetical protein
MSFIVKFCVTRHQFHVFLTFLHRLLRPKKGSSPRIHERYRSTVAIKRATRHIQE